MLECGGLREPSGRPCRAIAVLLCSRAGVVGPCFIAGQKFNRQSRRVNTLDTCKLPCSSCPNRSGKRSCLASNVLANSTRAY